MADKKKMVRASDASMMKRLAKKFLGAELLEDMTEAEMRQRLEKPMSVFGRMQAQAEVARELGRRDDLLNKAYKDSILRDFSKAGGEFGRNKVGREARDTRAGIDAMLGNIRKMKNGGAVMAGRGGKFKGVK